MTPTLRTAPALALLTGALAAAVGVSAPAQSASDQPPRARVAAEPAPIGLTASLTPSPAAADSLLRLSVVVENRGDRPVSAFRFEVAVDGRDLAVYRDELFLAPVLPGKRREIPLHNLWVSEEGRPPPQGGRLRVVVTLAEARWVARHRTADGIEWRAEGPVEGLPARATTEVRIR